MIKKHISILHCGNKTHIAGIKCDKNTTALAKLYKKEPLVINVKNNKMIYSSRSISIYEIRDYTRVNRDLIMR